MNQPKEKNLLEKTGENIVGFGQWLVTWATRGLWNIANIAWEVLDAPLPWRSIARVGDFIQKAAETSASAIERLNPELTEKKVATWAWEITSGLIWGSAIVKGLWKGFWLAWSVLDKHKKFQSLAPYAQKVGSFVQWSSMGSKVTKWTLQGAVETAWFQAVSEGKVTPKFVWTWAAIWWAIPVAWAVASKGKQFLTKKIPSSLQLQGLMNPAKVTKAKEEILKEWLKAPDDVAQWMLNRGIKWTKPQIIDDLVNRSKQSKQAVDDSLSLVKTRVKSDAAKKALQQSLDDVDNLAWLEDKAVEIKALLKKKDFSLSELNQVKRLLDDQYNLYTKSGDAASGIKAEGLRNIRSQIRKTIETEAKKSWVNNIAALNNETQVARTLADAIGRKDSAEAVRELLTAFAPSWVGGIIGSVAWPFDSSSIEWRVGNILVGMIAWRTLWSTRVKTNVASFLNKLNKKQLGALDEFLKSGGKAKLADDIAQKMDEILEIPTLQELSTAQQTLWQAGRYVTLPKQTSATRQLGDFTGSSVLTGWGAEVLQWERQ